MDTTKPRSFLLRLGSGMAGSFLLALGSNTVDPSEANAVLLPGRTHTDLGSQPLVESPLSSDSSSADSAKGAKVYAMRKFPYPYDAMLAISTDSDHQTLRKFNLVHEFLNTRDMTPMGRGLGLDVADSFFAYNGCSRNTIIDVGNVPHSEMMTYFQGTSAQESRYAPIIRRYIQAGWIDTMHSYGDYSQANQWRTTFCHKQAGDALRNFSNHDIHIQVWTDHGNASNVDNFGSTGLRAFFSYQQGAMPSSPYHHTHLTIPWGVRFAWSADRNSTFGHNSMISLKTLPDGHKVWVFWRYTNTGRTPSGLVEWVWSPGRLNAQLTREHLVGIKEHHQYAIIAQHLEGASDRMPLDKSAIAALRRLAHQYDEGHILVARTSRLLNYNVAEEHLHYQVLHRDHEAIINLLTIDDAAIGPHIPTLDDVRGITFYVSNPAVTRLWIDGVPVPETLTVRGRNDGIYPSVGIAWFPRDTHNYAEKVQ